MGHLFFWVLRGGSCSAVELGCPCRQCFHRGGPFLSCFREVFLSPFSCAVGPGLDKPTDGRFSERLRAG
ncbi:hypothetical protein BaRGS_00034621 [Batillaria attramentaria]|uniref:Secreted protein n=1 Tax=Batillaria attramentaria TaxID=370345 RepID=A0ABD0JGW3_9CAEN